MRPVVRTLRPPRANYEIRVVGDRRRPLLDFYHAVMRITWTATLIMIAVGYLSVNALFACGYLASGGIANAAPGSFLDAFFFSVQTMGTIGYGAMYPVTRGANFMVVLESLVGLILTALATGLVFAKFSRPTARVVFTRNAVISLVDGKPNLMLRIGNQRGNQIVGAEIRAVLTRTERTDEGRVFYRSLDLKLTRGHAVSLSRSWTLLHVIDEASPLFARTPEMAIAEELELDVTVVGLDDTFMQMVHARYHYFTHEILWGARHVDILSEAEDGAVVVDIGKFDVVEATEPTEAFPYTAARTTTVLT